MCGSRGIWQISLSSSQFYCKPKCGLKTIAFTKTKNQHSLTLENLIPILYNIPKLCLVALTSESQSKMGGKRSHFPKGKVRALLLIQQDLSAPRCPGLLMSLKAYPQGHEALVHNAWVRGTYFFGASRYTLAFLPAKGDAYQHTSPSPSSTSLGVYTVHSLPHGFLARPFLGPSLFSHILPTSLHPFSGSWLLLLPS